MITQKEWVRRRKIRGFLRGLFLFAIPIGLIILVLMIGGCL